MSNLSPRTECGILADFLTSDWADLPSGSKLWIGGWFRAKCNAAGLPKCTAHGLRKAGATRAAENGASDRQLMALFDWDSPSMAAVYTKAASQKRLAQQSVHLMQREQPANTRVAHPIGPLLKD